MKTILNTALITLASLSFAAADDDVRLADCPPAVQETVRSNLRDGRLDDLERITFKGETRYVAEIDLSDDDDLKLHISADGTLIKSREDVSMEDLPAAVKATLVSFGGEIEDLEKETAGNETTWHADIDRDDHDLDVVIAADGKVIRQTEDDD